MGHGTRSTGPTRTLMPRTPKTQEALDARDALASALSRAGIQLPAMDVRTPWADDGEVRYALVHLGVCSAPVALMLADVILRGIAP
ncbi:hypothetical protein ACIA7S_19555 [Streptomyces sp. NPDC051643]|uniref:hypothetical protein n=2 Tax=Streptomyces TaxID=1883 RepID=UPI00378AB6DB